MKNGIKLGMKIREESELLGRVVYSTSFEFLIVCIYD